MSITFEQNSTICNVSLHNLQIHKYPQLVNNSMIFKTFNNDIDKWTAKIGVFGKSFNAIFDAKNQKKIDINDLIVYKGMTLDEAKKQVGSFWSYLIDLPKKLAEI